MFKYVIIRILKILIALIEKIEFTNISLDENDVSKKILNSISISEYRVKSDTGYEKLTNLHITQPYRHYVVKTLDYKLSCADNHIVFDSNYKEFFVKDLKVGDLVQTKSGLQKVESIKIDSFKSAMFDTTVDHPNHRFYTNGILSHNTISSSIFMLHNILFNNDKNIMIVANKGDTAIEIVDKIKSIYTLLPFFLKPGIKTWNQKSLTFENGCRIKTSARTKTPAIGFTIDILYLDEFAHIPSNIIEPYYTAAYPTVSAIQNSKIIITSTPNGMNLFHKLLTNAERPYGDPLKNNFKAMRVYWHQVPGRFVTYLRLNDHRLYENELTKEDVMNIINNKWGHLTKVNMIWNLDLSKYVINIFNNDICKDEDIKRFTLINGKGEEISIHSIAEVTTWKEEAIKDIGGEDAFNQEYGLRFINASKSLLSEAIIDKLLKGKKNYKYEEIFELNKLKFSYKDLKWVDDEEIWAPIMRKNYKIVMSVDISEGLGQDYSVVNIFKVNSKSRQLIEEQKQNYQSFTDFFKLEQIGIYRNNFISVRQLAELLYLLIFEYFDPENVKVVLEINTYGNTLLAELPNVFEGNNNYGSSVFVRYKHRIDSTEEKIGLRIGDNKNLLVKDYQDLMSKGFYLINNEDNIREITTFVKHTTTAGNIKYAADIGNDDTVMTVINSTSIFKKPEFKEICEEWMTNFMDKEMSSFINECLNSVDYVEGLDYTQVLKVRRQYLNRNNNGINKGTNWFGLS